MCKQYLLWTRFQRSVCPQQHCEILPDQPLSNQELAFSIYLIQNGVGKQGYGNRPRIDDRNPTQKFSIDCLDASKTNE